MRLGPEHVVDCLHTLRLKSRTRDLPKDQQAAWNKKIKGREKKKPTLLSKGFMA